MKMKNEINEWNEQRTRSEEEPEEPHGHVRQIVIRRPGIIANLQPRKRRPILRKPKRAQPSIQPRILPQLPLVPPIILQHHHIRRPQHLMQRPHPLLRHPPTPINPTNPRGSQRTNGTPNAPPHPPKLHTSPPQLSPHLPSRGLTGPEPPHERRSVEFGGKDPRVQVRV